MIGRLQNLGIVGLFAGIAFLALIAGLGLMWAVRPQTEPAVELDPQQSATPA
jgi:hypothetical protein